MPVPTCISTTATHLDTLLRTQPDDNLMGNEITSQVQMYPGL